MDTGHDNIGMSSEMMDIYAPIFVPRDAGDMGAIQRPESTNIFGLEVGQQNVALQGRLDTSLNRKYIDRGDLLQTQETYGPQHKSIMKYMNKSDVSKSMPSHMVDHTTATSGHNIRQSIYHNDHKISRYVGTTHQHGDAMYNTHRTNVEPTAYAVKSRVTTHMSEPSPIMEFQEMYKVARHNTDDTSKIRQHVLHQLDGSETTSRMTQPLPRYLPQNKVKSYEFSTMHGDNAANVHNKSFIYQKSGKNVWQSEVDIPDMTSTNVMRQTRGLPEAFRKSKDMTTDANLKSEFSNNNRSTIVMGSRHRRASLA
jgi:hypothetical protein